MREDPAANRPSVLEMIRETRFELQFLHRAPHLQREEFAYARSLSGRIPETFRASRIVLSLPSFSSAAVKQEQRIRFDCLRRVASAQLALHRFDRRPDPLRRVVG